jgi:hypothetical protein
LLLIGQQGLGNFFRYWPLLPIRWRIVQILRQRLRKKTNTASTALIVQYKQQANPLLSMHRYTPLVNSGNEKTADIVKGTVQRELRWVKIGINRTAMKSGLPASVVYHAPRDTITRGA